MKWEIGSEIFCSYGAIITVDDIYCGFAPEVTRKLDITQNTWKIGMVDLLIVRVLHLLNNLIPSLIFQIIKLEIWV